ncbi:MAG: restriction endonuclease subunit S [Xanthomonadales bacterium]|nr:restriction endonuclease subunit S [Xanthomonadales bacterium]
MISRISVRGSFPCKKLADVVTFLDSRRRPITESDRRVGPFPYYGANGLQGWIDDFIFDEPLILLAEDGGHFGDPQRGIAYRISGKTWVNNHAHVLRVTSQVDIAYLCRVLENYDVTPFVTGTTRGKLTKAGASEILIPLPSISEQRRIAEVLDRVDALRTKRRATLAQLDNLTQSTFLDMFGDRGEYSQLESVVDLADAVFGKYGVKAGPFGSSLKKEDYTAKGYRIYGQEQVIAGRFDIGDYYIGERKYQQLKSCAVAEGDLLVSLVGSFGKVLVVPAGIEPGIINPRLLKITPDETLLSSMFLSHLLTQSSVQAALGRQAHGGTMGILNAGLLKKLKVILPPLALQKIFATRIAAIEALKTTQRAALAELDALFAEV